MEDDKNRIIVEMREEVESLRIRLRYLTNDYRLTREENEVSTVRYLELLANMEDLVEERTLQLDASRRVLEQKGRELQVMLRLVPSDGFLPGRRRPLRAGQPALR